MSQSQSTRAPLLTRRRLALIGLVVVVVLAGLLVAALKVEPTRAAVWHAVGTSCGQVILAPAGLPSTQPGSHDNRGAENCFAQAYAHCRPASLMDSELTGVDTSSGDTFVVEPGLLGPCGLADQWQSLVDAGLIRQGGTVSCAGLTQEADGLRLRGCGSLGDIVLPAES